MRKSKNLYLKIIILHLILIHTSFAAFNDIGIGARPLGLGGAFVALADDINAPNYNAAGLAFMEDIHIGATYAQRFRGLITYNSIGGIVPIGKIGTFGANINILSEDSDIYQEQTLQFSYAYRIIKQLGIGFNLKYFGISYDDQNEFVNENPYFAQTSSSDFSCDAGAITNPFKSLSIGISIENLLPTNMSISETQTDSIPINIRGGLVYRLESIAGMSAQGDVISNLLNATLATIEVASRNGDIYTRLGVEMWLNKSIGIRGGYGLKTSGNSAATLSLGGSAKIPISGTTLQLDYGFQFLNADLQDNTTQRFSLNLLF